MAAELRCELIVFNSQHVDDAGERVDGLLLLSAVLIQVGQAALCGLELVAKSLLAVVTIVALAAEAGIKRHILTHRHTDLKEEFYARVRAQNRIPEPNNHGDRQIHPRHQNHLLNACAQHAFTLTDLAATHDCTKITTDTQEGPA